MFVKEQIHLNTHETIDSKQHFELHCRDFGVVPQAYQSDNGTVFTSSEYTSHLTSLQQISSFAGVGAHHHNGIAERGIQTVMSIARTMLLHAAIHWPEMADAKLWPLAVQQAVFLYNHMPSTKNGLSPHDLFTKTRWTHTKFQDLHVWGCPTFVLDKTIADGKKIPRWQPRSSRQVYVGMSPKHASSVPLVLNPETGAITPQFNVVFDDWFATVATPTEDLPDFESEDWNRLFGDSLYQYVFDGDNSDSSPDLTDEATPHAHDRRAEVSNAFERVTPSRPLPIVSNPHIPHPAFDPTAASPELTPSSPVDCRVSPSFPSQPSSSRFDTPVHQPDPLLVGGLSPVSDHLPQRENPSSLATSTPLAPRVSSSLKPSSQREKEATTTPTQPPILPKPATIATPSPPSIAFVPPVAPPNRLTDTDMMGAKVADTLQSDSRPTSLKMGTTLPPTTSLTCNKTTPLSSLPSKPKRLKIPTL